MRMPGTIWKPVCNYSPGQIGPVVGMVVHHMVSDENSAYRHFNTPGSGASAHFGVDYDGTIYQYVDTNDAAYHACQANYNGQVGVENASASTGDLWQPLTDEQVSACGRILAWLHDAHGVELRVADPSDRRGCGYHSMVPGDCSIAWGQTGCPGDNIIAQRAEMVRQAQGGSGTDTPQEDEDVMYIAVGDALMGRVACAVDGGYRIGELFTAPAVAFGIPQDAIDWNAAAGRGLRYVYFEGDVDRFALLIQQRPPGL